MHNRLFTTTYMCFLLVLTILVSCTQEEQPNPPKPNPPPIVDVIEPNVSFDKDGLVVSLNSFRNSAKVDSVSYSLDLQAAAQDHAQDMCANKFLSDIGSNGKGVMERLEGKKYIASAALELVAVNKPSLLHVIEFWKNNQYGFINLTFSEVKEIGLGAVKTTDTKYNTCWVLVLASRL